MNPDFLITVKRTLKRIAYRLLHYTASRQTIDWVLVNGAYAKYDLEPISREMRQRFLSLGLDQKENTEYFNNLLHYIGKEKFLPNNPFYLYPSNVAIIDFLLRQNLKQETILDYGCGLGNLMVYLKSMGFKNTHGYDDFSQIKKETILTFLGGFNTQEALLEKKAALSLRNTIAVCSCFFWSRLGQDMLQKEKDNKRLRYILIDSDYAPHNIDGFTIERMYNNLLVVFKRI